MEKSGQQILVSDFVFTDDIMEAFSDQYMDYVAHIFIHQGSVQFRQDDNIYNVLAGNCLILASGKPVRNISFSPDLKTSSIIVSNRFFKLNLPQSPYNIIGRLSMMENPVLPINLCDTEVCMDDMRRIKLRLSQRYHTFYSQIVRREVENFVFDLYDVHARHQNRIKGDVSQSSQILQRFIGLLDGGMFRTTRRVDDYAAKLFITPKYLSKACIKASRHNASYWIERYTMEQLSRELIDTDKSFTSLTDEYHFYSISHFSRYVKKVSGRTPSQLREKRRND